MLLLTSPNGKTGLSIIKKLNQHSIPYKVLTSSYSSKIYLKNCGVKNINIGNIRNINDIKLALKGTNQTYLVTPNFFFNEFSVVEKFISIASTIPNYKLIFHSVIHPQIKMLPHHWAKMKIENKLISSKLKWTILQPTMYMQNILPQIEKAKINKFIGMPIPIDQKLSMVDLNDVSEIVIKAISEDTLEYGIYELVGESLSLQDQAKAIGKLLKLDIDAQQFTLKSSKTVLKIPFKGRYGENTYDKMFKYYSENGLRGNSNTLRNLLGREPTKFNSMLKKHLKCL
tara:strand:- start:32 stop:886 length:855 start_codon:yes stop_codon:yes gene_type:complete